MGFILPNNLPKIKDEAYRINLDDNSDIGTHWIAFYFHNNNVTYFNSFGVEHIPKEIKAFIKTKNIKTKNTIIRFDNVWIFLYWIY